MTAELILNGLQWLLVRTKVRAESIAVEHLERQGYTVYCPRACRARRVRGRWIGTVESLFPRYLFLRLDMTRQSLGPVRSTMGVSEIVRFGNEYAVVPHAVVEGLMKRGDPDTGLCHLREPLFVEGAAVRVSGGPLDGLEGVFERYGGEERVVVLLHLLGREARIWMSVNQLAPESAY